MDPATILIVAAASWVGAEAVHRGGDTAKELGGDIAAWRRGETPPSHKRWLKDHERRMAKLTNKQQRGSRQNTNAALLNAMRMAENATSRSARRSDQKTQAHRDYLAKHGNELARDRVAARIARHRRSRETADLFWAAWDEQIERAKEHLARKRNDRLGNVTDGRIRTDGPPTTGKPAPGGAAPDFPTVDPQVLVLLVDLNERDTASDQHRRTPPPPPGWSTDYTHRSRPDPPPEPEKPPAEPDPVRAYAERIQDEVPALAAPAPTGIQPAPVQTPELQPATSVDDDGIIDAEVIDDDTPTSEAASTELATVHPINTKTKGITAMSTEGLHTAVANKIKELEETMQSMIGIVRTSTDELREDGWNGDPMDLMERGISQAKDSAASLTQAAELIETGGNAVGDAYEAHSFVGGKSTIGQG